VHIKVEDTTSGEDTDGEGNGKGKGKEEEEEEVDEEGKGQEEDSEEEDGQQREQHARATGASADGRLEAGVDAVAPPRRARLPPGSYADTVVEHDTDDDYEEEEEEGEEEEEKAEPRGRRAHVRGVCLTTGGSQAGYPQSLPSVAHSEPGSPRAWLRAPGRVADNDVPNNDLRQQQDVEEADFPPSLRKRGGPGPPGSSRFKGITWAKS